MIRRGFLALCLAGVVAAALTASSGAWTTNLVVLDDGTCGTNLQIGSDKTASSSVTPSFLAYGDGPSSSYQVFIDGVSIGTFAANSMSNVCIYAPTLSQGPHTLTGNEVVPHAGSPLTPLSFSVDSIPPAAPSAPLMNPFFDTGISTTDGITHYRGLGFSGTADPLTSVLMYNGLVGMGGTKSDSSGAWSLASPTLADGTYQFKAAAFDSAGNKSQFSSITTITVDGTPPTAQLTSPLTGQILSGTVALSATASDNLGLWKVDFQIDGVTKQTVTGSGPTFSWNWSSSSVANGNHTLTAIATDVAGNTTSSAVTITVQNGSATVPGAPSLNAATAGNGSVGLSWSPTSDGGSTITGYKLYRGTSSGGETLLTTLGNVTSYTDSGLANGTTYYYKVSAVNGIGESTLSTERFATPATVPGAPSLTSATAGSGSVSLAWSAPTVNGGSAVTGYKLYRGTTSGGETLLTTLGNVTSYTDSGLANGTTYYYKLTAVNGAGEGAFSNEKSATPTAAATAPFPPTLSSASPGNGVVSIVWSAPGSDGGSPITGYRIYRGTTSGGETLLTTVGTVTSYLDTSVANGTAYYYKVSAVNAIGESGLSNELTATPAGVPGPPTLSAATRGNGTVGLSWTAPTNTGGMPLSGYKVYRGTASGGETLLTSLGNVTSWTDSGLANGTTYYYKVTAVTSAGESTLSNETSATPATVPSSPSLGTPVAGNGTVALAWSAPTSTGGSPITGYRVYRGTTSGGETLFTTLGNVTSFTDTGLANGTTYYYEVSAVNGVGEGLLSNERSAVPATVPGAPTIASAAGSDSSVSLSWSPPASNGGSAVTGYRVYRSTLSGAETLLTTLGNVSSWTDTGLANGTTYYYKVSALNAVGEGSLSAERSATPSASATVPGPPTLTTATGGNASVGLVWSAPVSNGGSSVTGYKVYRSTLSGGETLLTTLGNVTSWSDTGLANGTTYYYKVSAVNAVGEGSQSAERSATPATVPGAPSLNSASAGNGTVGLSWSAPTSNGGSAVSGYRVYRGTASGGEGLLTTLGNVTSYTDSGLANGTTYFYEVTAVNVVGEGTLSIERSGTPAGVPGAPTLTATAGNANVALGWSTPASNGSAISGYRIYRSTSSGGETLLTTVGTVTSYTDSGLANGTTYYYEVSAVNGLGEGLPSAERSGTPSGLPGAPTLGSATAGNANVGLSWTAPASTGGSAISGYRVYRGTASGGETLLTTLGNVTSYTDFGAVNGTTYYYKVSAVNATGEGTLSNELSATPFVADSTPPSQPGSPKAPSVGTGQIALNWSGSTDNVGVTGYRIYRDGVVVATSPTNYYLDSGLAAASTHTYAVAAVDAAGNVSTKSSTISAKTASIGTSTGTIGGAVFGSNGSPVQNAVATTTANGSSKRDKTGPNGAWQLSGLPPGTYTVTITANGYRTQTLTLTVAAGQTVIGVTGLST